MIARHLILFVKAPRLGRVKSRLARDIGRVGAWAFYRRQLTARVRDLARDRRWTFWLAVTPDRAVFDGGLWPGRTRRLSQGGGDLGDRMLRTMAVLPPGPVVLIGADIPGVTPARIARAFRALGAHDAVFGPAADGGFWLVGLRRRPRLIDPFKGVRWSTDTALADTLANLKGARVARVDTLEDVDDGAAYARHE